MYPTLKLVLFFVFFGVIVIGGFKAYKYCNEKIQESASGWQLLGFSLLLVIMNVALFFGGLYLLVATYAFLSE